MCLSKRDRGEKMSLFFKRGFYLELLFFSALVFISCEKNVLSKQASLKPGKLAEETQRKATEEEIQYFLPGGRYTLSISRLRSRFDDYIDSEWYIREEDIGKDIKVINREGNVVDLWSQLELVDIEGDPYFKTSVNIEGYKTIDESYWPSLEPTLFCTGTSPEVLPEKLILDDNFLARLYDKNGKVISEFKMRNDAVRPIEYNKYPLAPRNTIKSHGFTRAWVFGMLKLPPKGQREGLKYRIVRLDKNGNPRPYLYEGAKKPYQYYLREEVLPPYSEYKNWSYYEDEKTGVSCYTTARRQKDPSDKRVQVIQH